MDYKKMQLKIIILLLLAVSITPVYATSDLNIILGEIRQLKEDTHQLRADMNKRFEQIDKRFEQVDKRFEQVDKRFEQINKHFDFLQQLVYLLMGLIFASPFLAVYLKSKSEGRLQAVIFALKEASQDDPKLSRALKIAGLD